MLPQTNSHRDKDGSRVKALHHGDLGSAYHPQIQLCEPLGQRVTDHFRSSICLGVSCTPPLLVYSHQQSCFKSFSKAAVKASDLLESTQQKRFLATNRRLSNADSSRRANITGSAGITFIWFSSSGLLWDRVAQTRDGLILKRSLNINRIPSEGGGTSEGRKFAELREPLGVTTLSLRVDSRTACLTAGKRMWHYVTLQEHIISSFKGYSILRPPRTWRNHQTQLCKQEEASREQKEMELHLTVIQLVFCVCSKTLTEGFTFNQSNLND